ncbi:MAG: hypothetical protein RMJ60_05280 [Anaerolineales bacterium]|nr:hypothetical protein [Anaerolineales bacterium]
MSRLRPWLFSLLFCFLAACAPQTADCETPTATPTPSLSPIATPPPGRTPTPTPLPHPPDFTMAFRQGPIRYQNGRWLVTASYRMADNSLQTADFVRRRPP